MYAFRIDMYVMGKVTVKIIEMNFQNSAVIGLALQATRNATISEPTVGTLVLAI